MIYSAGVLRGPFCCALVSALLAASFSQSECSAADQKPLRIVAFGDSTTATRDTIKAVYAQRLAAELPKRGLAAEIINAGIGGNTTADAMARFQRDVVDRKPDLVIMQFGLNDASVDVWKDRKLTTTRVALEKYRDNLRQMISQLKDRKVRVILMTPNPMCWTPRMREIYGHPPYDPKDPQGFNVLVKDYAAAAREVAREQGVTLVDVHENYQQHAKDPRRSLATLMPDGIHPNDQGQEIITELLIPEIIKARREAK